MKCERNFSLLSKVALLVFCAVNIQGASAQQSSAETLLEEITVTARKRSQAEDAQSVPLAVSAFGAGQLETMQFRNLFDIGHGLPNVSVDAANTTPGVANIAIRGLGINTSVPTATPTVGVFVDGVYLGVNYGVLMDMFDIDNVQVLRGPQGLLFGRNVTGGAVLINTKRPSDEFELSTKFGVESGPLWTAAASVTGPIAGDTVTARLTGYYAKDEGWFFNEFDQDEHGRGKSVLIRPSIQFQPSESLDIILRYEHGKQDGDGTAFGNTGLFGRNSHKFSNDLHTFHDIEWDKVTGELNWDVAFGDGTITNIAGWRTLRQTAALDIDSSPSRGPLLPRHSFVDLDAEQFSNEFRYSGSFFDGFVDTTVGVYYYEQDMGYQQNSQLQPPPGGGIFYGGLLDEYSVAVFSAFDFHLTDTLTLNTGIRYSYEEKETQTARAGNNRAGTGIVDITVSPPGTCDILRNRCAFDFFDEHDWDSWTPKVGLEWQAMEDVLLYGFWTKGFRSGGYNIQAFPPGPYDQESQDSFEVGAKTMLLEKRLRWNTAFFYSDVRSLQRTVVTFDPEYGFVRITSNAGDATIWGIETNIDFLMSPNLTLSAAYGYTNGEYDEVFFDLDRSRVVNDAGDLALELPRLTPHTGSVGFVYDQSMGDLGAATLSFNYNYRDRSYYSDNNSGYLNKMNVINANLEFTTLNERLTLSVYGKNLLDEVQYGISTPLPPPNPRGHTLSTLTKGRMIGASLTYTY